MEMKKIYYLLYKTFKSLEIPYIFLRKHHLFLLFIISVAVTVKIYLNTKDRLTLKRLGG